MLPGFLSIITDSCSARELLNAAVLFFTTSITDSLLSNLLTIAIDMIKTAEDKATANPMGTFNVFNTSVSLLTTLIKAVHARLTFPLTQPLFYCFDRNSMSRTTKLKMDF